MFRVPTIFCVIGSILLLVTAVLHGLGYSQVSDAISKSNVSAFLKHVVPGLWAHFVIHLVILAAFGLVLAFSIQRVRILQALLALAAAADAAWAFSLAGFFVGVALPAAAALCFAFAALAPNNSIQPTR
ncbi:MAG: hypothetical protein JSR56_02555 [Proteobacteria bacterium]|nr:hypothetical protein [Pseudomonadota bacterium]